MIDTICINDCGNNQGWIFEHFINVNYGEYGAEIYNLKACVLK